MNKRKGVLFGVFFAFIIILSFYFDSQIVKGVSLIKSNFLDEFFMGINFISSEIIIFFVLTSLFLWNEYKRKWILPLWVSFALSVLVSFLLKISVQRQRPFQLGLVSILPALEKASYSIWDFSFVSAHTMIIFCAVPLLSKEFPKLKYFWIIFAGLVAFSRIYFGLHFLSDVLVGGALGYLIGIFIVDKEKGRFFEKFWKRIKD